MPIKRHLPFLSHGLAAGFLLLMGTMLGWYAHGPGVQAPISAPGDIAQQWVQNTSYAPAGNQSRDLKLMLQVSTDDPHRLDNLLDETQRILESTDFVDRKVYVEILTKGAGLSLVRNQESAQAKRIKELQSRYSNLIISACGLALKNLQTALGKNIELLPNTQVVPSALHEVIKRQQEGWIFINI